MKNAMNISGQMIGPEHPTYFIADVAANHDGDLEKAKDLIYAAAEANADAAKFQNFQAHTIVSDHGFKSLGAQKSHQSKWEKSVFEIYESASLPLSWTETLKETCDKAGIHYFTSPYSPELVQAVSPYVTAWKMGSGEITWHVQIAEMCKDGKPFIMATGASTLSEVEDAVNTALTHCSTMVLMQCNTNYTASLDEEKSDTYERFKCINLRVLSTYSEKFPNCILGLSDHTHGHDTVLGAVGLYDARVIEKHFTLDNDATGPDHPFSMTPETWSDMVAKTRALENTICNSMTFQDRYATVLEHVADSKAFEHSLGDGIKRIEENERETVILQRRAMRLLRDVKGGEIISQEDIYPLRPAPTDCIPPYKIENYLGKKLARNLARGEYLKHDDFE